LKSCSLRAYLRRIGPVDSGAKRQSKGKDTLSPIASSRASSRRVPEPVSKRVDANKRPGVKDTLNLILARLDDIKAEDTVTIDLTGKTSIADIMVVTSGRSNRHVGAVADRVIEGLKAAGIRDVHVEGMPHCDWVLIDAGDVIVHVFRPEVRAFYSLEKMWAGSTRGRRAS
jgi:ribosome-associated protein